MKTIATTLFTLLLSTTVCFGQDIKEDVLIIFGEEEYTIDTEVVIKNINGGVKVSGYEGDNIVVKGTKELWKEGKDISNGEAEDYSLQTEEYNGNLYLYVDAPNTHVEFRKGRIDYHWHWDDDERDRIDFHFDLEIQIPKKLMVSVSTVNGGEVLVEDMENGVKARNVNGSIKVKDVKGYTTASTVNGNIEVWFLESPTENTGFKTVNGTIEVYSPKDLSAVITFESLHGELYTDFEQVQRLPNRLNKEKSGKGYRYRIDQNSPIQVGDGDIEISFEMVNGSAYIRERKS